MQLFFKLLLILSFTDLLSAPTITAPNYLFQENPQFFNNLTRSAPTFINVYVEGWLLISEPGTTPVIYYAPLSVSTVKPGFASVTSLINYTSDQGKAESLLGITVYDCAMGTKQEQSTVQYSQHWADGDVVLQIGLEEAWQPVKLGTEGMRLLKVACDLRLNFDIKYFLHLIDHLV